MLERCQPQLQSLYLFNRSCFVFISGGASKRVAFHAVVDQGGSITIKQSEKLMCKHVKYSTGGGCNPHTGVFTVPVSGVYCFLAMSTPQSQDADYFSWFEIQLDDNVIANLAAYGKGRSTAHAVVHATAGQNVFLQSMKDDNKCFGGWNTSFSGFLICPDV
jgi:hypothetical protein